MMLTSLTLANNPFAKPAKPGKPKHRIGKPPPKKKTKS